MHYPGICFNSLPLPILTDSLVTATCLSRKRKQHPKQEPHHSCYLQPWNHRMSWVGRDLKAHTAQPAALGRAASHQLILPRAPSNSAWSTSRDGAPTGSVGNHHEVQSFFPSCVTRESKTDVAELRQASRSLYQHPIKELRYPPRARARQEGEGSPEKEWRKV